MDPNTLQIMKMRQGIWKRIWRRRRLTNGKRAEVHHLHRQRMKRQNEMVTMAWKKAPQEVEIGVPSTTFEGSYDGGQEEEDQEEHEEDEDMEKNKELGTEDDIQSEEAVKLQMVDQLAKLIAQNMRGLPEIKNEVMVLVLNLGNDLSKLWTVLDKKITGRQLSFVKNLLNEWRKMAGIIKETSANSLGIPSLEKLNGGKRLRIWN